MFLDQSQDQARITAEIERLQAEGDRPSHPQFSAACRSLIEAHAEAYEIDDDSDRHFHAPDPLLVRQALRTISFLVSFREFEPVANRVARNRECGQ